MHDDVASVHAGRLIRSLGVGVVGIEIDGLEGHVGVGAASNEVEHGIDHLVGQRAQVVDTKSSDQFVVR
ncbi:MAG: hypothetical protein R2854_19305 [Caldilineaceae bacterium]